MVTHIHIITHAQHSQYTCAHACILLYMHTRKCTHIHIWTHEHVHIYIHFHTPIHMHIPIYRYTFTFSLAHMYILMCAHQHTYTHAKMLAFPADSRSLFMALPLYGIPQDLHILSTVCSQPGKPSAACDCLLHSSRSSATWTGHILYPLILINIDPHLSYRRTVSCLIAQELDEKASLWFLACCHQITLTGLGKMAQRTADPEGHKTLSQEENRSRRASGTALGCVVMVCD